MILNFKYYFSNSKTFILTSFGFAALTFSVGALAQWAPTLIYRTSQQLSMNGKLSHPYRYVNNVIINIV